MNSHGTIFRITGCMLLAWVGWTGVPAQQWTPVPFIRQETRDAGIELGGEEGQWPQTIVFEPITGRYALYGTDVGGLFRSTDEGTTWQPSNIGYSPRGVAFFAIDPNQTDRVIAVGGMKFGNSNNGASLSKDGGQTWESTHRMFNKDYKHYKDAVAYDPSSLDSVTGHSKVAYWSCPPSAEPTGPVLFKSVDGGESWSVVNDDPAYGNKHVKVAYTTGSVFVFGDGNLHRSTDGGTTFDEILTGNVHALEVVRTLPGTLFLMKSDGIYQSTDDGDTWVRTGSAGIPNNPQRLRISPVNTDHMIHWRDVSRWNWPRYYTTDGGNSWHESDLPRGDLYFFNWRMPRQADFSYHPTNGQVILSVGNDNVTKSTDQGATFRWSNSGVNNFCPSGIHNLNPFNHELLLIVGKDKAGAYSRNGGTTWINAKPIELSYSGGQAYSGYAMTEDILVACGLDRDADGKWKICVSTDGGENFINTGIEAAGKRTVCPDITDPARVYLGAYRSSDYGKTWIRMTGAEGVFTYNPEGDHELYGCNGSMVVRSDDHGISWTGIVGVGSDIDDIAIDQKTGTLYIAAGGDLYTCRSDGSNLQRITERTPADQFGNRNIKSVAVDPNHPGVAYAANSSSYLMDNNIVRTTDHGQSWEILTRNTRFPNPQYGKDGGRMPGYVRVCPTTSEAYVGGGCFGLWKIGPPPGSSPVVKVTIPENLNNLVMEDTVQIEVEVFNRNAPVERGHLFVNGNQVAEFAPDPWIYRWVPKELGTFEIHATATDTAGQVTESRPLSATVLLSKLPEVRITSPEPLREFEYGSPIGIEVAAVDPDGTITLVEFFSDSAKIGEVTGEPFFLSWDSATEGSHDLTASATDNTGQRVVSLPVTVLVKEKPYSHFYTEDFNDGLAQDWMPGGSWSLVDSTYRSPGTANREISVYLGALFRDYRYGVKARPTQNEYFGMVFHHADGANYYYAGLVTSPPVAVLKRVSDGVETKLDQVYYPGGGIGVWTELEITCREGRTTLRINDSTLMAHVPTPHPDSGRIGLFTTNQSAWFDDVNVAARYMQETEVTRVREKPGHQPRIYPNPAEGPWFYAEPGKPEGTWRIEVFDMTGRRVFDEVTAEARIAVATHHLESPGMFLLKASDGLTVWVTKFILR